MSRPTGKSLACALRVIADAMTYQGDRIPIIDHHGTHEANRLLTKTVESLIKTLELKGFVIGRGNNTLSYTPEW